MRDAVFLTGATGFLGTEIADRLIHMTGQKLYVLVRAGSQEEALHRLKAAWQPYPELYAGIMEQVFPVIGDFTQAGLGIGPEQKACLKEEVGLVIHSGAEVSVQKDASELRRVNKEGTANMLAFAGQLPGLKRFVQISTAYVAGQQEGLIPEDGRPETAAKAASSGKKRSKKKAKTSYSTFYEQSKAEAEELVKASGLPYAICRPGMIVGNSGNGYIKNFNTIYYVLKLMLTGKLPVLPVEASMGLNLIPVDEVARSVAEIAFAPEAAGRCFHLTCPKAMQPTAGELVDYVRKWAKENLAYDMSAPVMASLPALKKAGLWYNRKEENRKKSMVSNLLALMPYFSGNQEFDRSNTDAVCGAYEISWQNYIDPLLTFACRKNFMHQTERTVFEQADVRRMSSSFPVNYHDVRADGIVTVSGAEVNERIRRIVDALWAWGIRRGDKVAMTGINCVDYITLDQAIGRIGAVSVPIYYTTPIEEAQLLLNRSGARWFFVGDRRIMEHIEQLEGDIRVVAFSAGLEVHKPGVMHWEQFLYEARESAPACLVDPEDLATIRYTSGTTGEPKGVMFNYGQLAWMGEVLTNLLPWEDRNRSMRYLSFLPQSHVVEGILASYAPYYMLAKVDLYYLNDFGALVDMLPKVRPTVFFSVPRFYEKLWDQLAANPIGKKYLAMPEGSAKKALALLLRKVILKKAGLDACNQLIVGSAPISEQLLQNFRALGIEIYNAYGQTEAPLITINRLGDNIIPSIGTPLPDTEVTVTEEGELIVKGPQVCLGYYGLETDTIRDGVLKTGDLGSIDETGHITLRGRKKEMIITAYGKNISIPKIEERLKNIAAVSEAVLIGENRPYCTALLWLDGESAGQTDMQAKLAELKEQIEQMNANLSHPEQIRKFRVISTPLSIAKGELTPNLKVKRGNVQEHYAEIIEEMYR